MIWWVMGAVVGLVGLALAAWALLWDRPRGRLRCPRCWYAMEGAPQADDGKRRCPECGRRATERGLRRTRRRWRWVGVALVLFIGAGVLGVQPKVKRDGWLGLAPTWALVELVPLGGIEGEMGRELMRRMGIASRRDGSMRASMTPGQQLLLLRRLRHGNVLSRPGDERWADSYGNVARNRYHAFVTDVSNPLASGRFMDGSPATEELQSAIAALFDTPATLHVHTRDRWPRDLRPLIETRVEHWWPIAASDHVQITWSAGDRTGETGARGYFTLPVIEGEDEVAVDLKVNVLQRMHGPTAGERMLFSEAHTLRYQLVDGINDIMTPVRSAEVDNWLASWIKPEITQGTLLRFGLPWGRDCPVDISDVAFGMRIDIPENGEEIASQRVRWQEYYGNGNGAGGAGDRWDELKEALQTRGDSGKWTVRLRPDPEWAMYMIDAHRYWDGEITLPLTVNLPTPPPPPPPAPEGQ